MSKLNELLAQFCPNGVEYKTVQDICVKVSSGGTPNSKVEKYYGGTIPWLRTQEVDFCEITDTGIKITEEGLNNSSAKWIPPHCVVVAMYGATVGKVAFTSIPLTTNQACCNLEVDSCIANYKYVYYCLSNLYEYVKSLGQGSQTNINAQIVKSLRIPIPPLEVQAEIVRILDNFTELTSELTSELTARKQQYETYATDMFMKYKDSSVVLADLATFVYGYTDKAKDVGDTRFIRITDIDDQGTLKRMDAKYIQMNEEAKKSLLSYGDLIMARTGATYGKTLFFDSEEPSVYASFLIKIIPDNKRLLNRFYWHFTKTPIYWEQANRLVTTGGQPQFNTPALKQINVPLPPIEEQQTIIEVLDKLDALCTNLSVGLPAEIEARQKQYEYYRDKLLAFPELKQ